MNNVQTTDLKDFIRRRPGMFIGSTQARGYLNMLQYLLEDLTRFAHEGSMVEIICHNENRITIHIHNADYPKFRKLLQKIHNLPATWSDPLGILGYLFLCSDITVMVCHDRSETILYGNEGITHLATNITTAENSFIYIDSRIDDKIFKDFTINYVPINAALQQFAYLNPTVKIITLDKTSDELQRNVFYYPNGVIDQLTNRLMIQPDYYQSDVIFDYRDMIDNYTIRVGACYDHNKGTTIRTFANNHETTLGGSLLNGILKGFVEAIRQIADQHGNTVKINKRTAKRGLQLFAGIRGDNFVFYGATRERLGMPELEKPLKNRIQEQFLLYLTQHEKIRNSIIGAYKIWEEND